MLGAAKHAYIWKSNKHRDPSSPSAPQDDGKGFSATSKPYNRVCALSRRGNWTAQSREKIQAARDS
jgi:hypothetical protein